MPVSTASSKLSKKRTALLKAIAEFDPSDQYHDGDHPVFDDGAYGVGYYDALERVGWLLRGEIEDWQSPKPKNVEVRDPYTL